VIKVLRRGLPLLLLLTLACTATERPAREDAAHSDTPEADAEVADADEADAEQAADAGEPPEPQSMLARNIIVFMGDGMGPEQLSTARYAKHRGALRYEELAGPAYVNTDSLTTSSVADPELEPTDSAAAASAIATGVRVQNGWLSLTSADEPLETVLEACQKVGKATGLVTTSYFYDASPAAFGVHQPTRERADLIARQLLRETRPDVVMGNGALLFDDGTVGLHAEAQAAGYVVLRGVAELAAWDPAAESRLLGLFETDFHALAQASEPFSMTPALERRDDSPDPTLATMTERALARLERDPDGFFLFAEDEILDEIGHRGPAEVEWANRAYPEQVAALDAALGVAIDWVRAHSSFDETLIVLLADHETGGYHYDHAVGPSSGQFSAFSVGADYASGNHTRTKTAVYALGPGSEAISTLKQHTDTHRLLMGELR
jgi:alkaline phosphatase